jgi:signal transduction histidine kinase
LPARQNGAVDWDRITGNATIAREQIMRCRGTTQHFLRLSRGTQSCGDILDVDQAVATVVRLVDPTARARAVALEVLPVAPGLRVHADEADLQHALINLILNAVQASKQGGRVVISVEGGETVRFRVADEGCGIPAEHLSRIFEPFFSLRKDGTGLGLFLSLNCIRRWGGDIRVESVSGKGSTFEVVLPNAGAAPEYGSAG